MFNQRLFSCISPKLTQWPFCRLLTFGGAQYAFEKWQQHQYKHLCVCIYVLIECVTEEFIFDIYSKVACGGSITGHKQRLCE